MTPKKTATTHRPAERQSYGTFPRKVSYVKASKQICHRTDETNGSHLMERHVIKPVHSRALEVHLEETCLPWEKVITYLPPVLLTSHSEQNHRPVNATTSRNEMTPSALEANLGHLVHQELGLVFPNLLEGTGKNKHAKTVQDNVVSRRGVPRGRPPSPPSERRVRRRPLPGSTE